MIERKRDFNDCLGSLEKYRVQNKPQIHSFLRSYLEDLPWIRHPYNIHNPWARCRVFPSGYSPFSSLLFVAFLTKASGSPLTNYPDSLKSSNLLDCNGPAAWWALSVSGPFSILGIWLLTRLNGAKGTVCISEQNANFWLPNGCHPAGIIQKQGRKKKIGYCQGKL